MQWLLKWNTFNAQLDLAKAVLPLTMLTAEESRAVVVYKKAQQRCQLISSNLLTELEVMQVAQGSICNCLALGFSSSKQRDKLYNFTINGPSKDYRRKWKEYCAVFQACEAYGVADKSELHIRQLLTAISFMIAQGLFKPELGSGQARVDAISLTETKMAEVYSQYGHQIDADAVIKLLPSPWIDALTHVREEATQASVEEARIKKGEAAKTKIARANLFAPVRAPEAEEVASKSVDHHPSGSPTPSKKRRKAQ